MPRRTLRNSDSSHARVETSNSKRSSLFTSLGTRTGEKLLGRTLIMDERSRLKCSWVVFVDRLRSSTVIVLRALRDIHESYVKTFLVRIDGVGGDLTLRFFVG